MAGNGPTWRCFCLKPVFAISRTLSLSLLSYVSSLAIATPSVWDRLEAHITHVTEYSMGALEFLCDIRFHRSFVLPANEARGRSKPFRVSYADYGDRRSDAVVLLCGALMATRFCYSPLDYLAKSYNVRIVHPDRPGIGGTDPVELHERIPIWLGRSMMSSPVILQLLTIHRGCAPTSQTPQNLPCLHRKPQRRSHICSEHYSDLPESSSPSHAVHHFLRPMGPSLSFRRLALASHRIPTSSIDRPVCIDGQVRQQQCRPARGSE